MSGTTFAPAPGAAPAWRMVAAQTSMELRLLLRNGEQLLLTMIIPTLLLVMFATLPLLMGTREQRIDFLAPGVIALAVMSTAFTSQAIHTGFQRRYGVLKRLAATPLPTWGLLTAKTVTVLAVEAMQIGLLCAVAVPLGWSPRGSLPAAAALVLLGTAAFSGLGLLLAGTLRAEATLAAANLIYVVLLAVGGVIFPLTRFPEGIRAVLEALPIAALSAGLRAALQHGATIPARPVLILSVWGIAALAAASLTFRWE